MHTPQDDEIIIKTHQFMSAAEKALTEVKDNRAIFECTECHGKAIAVRTGKGVIASCNHCEIRVMN